VVKAAADIARDEIVVGSRTELKKARSLSGTWNVHDLTLAKLPAGREHDFEFVEDALRAELVDIEQLRLGVDLMPSREMALVRERLEGILARVALTEAAGERRLRR